MRFSKLANRKYLELLGEKGKEETSSGGVGGVQENSGQGPFEWKTAVKSSGSLGTGYPNIGSLENAESFPLEGEKGGVHDVKEKRKECKRRNGVLL